MSWWWIPIGWLLGGVLVLRWLDGCVWEDPKQPSDRVLRDRQERADGALDAAIREDVRREGAAGDRSTWGDSGDPGGFYGT